MFKTSRRPFFSGAVCIVLALQGCGKKDDDKTEDDSSTPGSVSGGGGGGSGSASAPEMKSAAFSNVEDATDAINDDAAASGGAGLWLAGAAVDVVSTRSCAKAEDGTVSVTVARSGSGSRTDERTNVTVNTEISATGTDVRKWTAPEGQTIDCVEAAGTVRVAWRTDAAVNGLMLDITTDKSKTAVSTATSAVKTRVINRSASVKGSRAVVFSALTSEDATVVAREKSIISSVSRTESRTVDSDTAVSTTTTNATKDGAPLVVRVERSATDGSLLQKIVKSGTMTSIAADGSTVETGFADLAFDMTAGNTNRCMPVSGTITGSSFATGATEATSTFIIKFGGATASGVSIAVDGGAEEDYPDYDPSGCDLEREI